MKKLIFSIIIIAALVGCKKESGTYSLSYSPEKIAYPGGTIAVDVKSDFVWEVLPYNVALYTIDKTNGKGNDVITVTVIENDGFELHDTIFVKFNNSENEVLPIVIQQEKSPLILHIAPMQQYVPNTQKDVTLTVTSNVLWTVVPNANNPANLTLSLTSGGSAILDNVVVESVVVTVPQNIDWNERGFLIDFTGAGISTTRTVTISQAANGVIINELIWSSFNVDDAGTFVENPGAYGKYYQFNSLNDGWIANRIYTDNSNWLPANDPSPNGWRLPTRDELTALRDYLYTSAYCRWEVAPVRAWNAVGMWIGTNALTATSDNVENCIFLPAAGKLRYDNGILDDVGVWGYYWSSTSVSDNVEEGSNFNFFFLTQPEVRTETGKKTRGCTIRPVRDIQ
ncbi:MAG: hypothetical protein LBS50_03095 [Prevotellaceae bacterium]|nr:hypothetical protein [Prevotellaceae bacterium]